MSLGDPYLSVDRAYEQQGRMQDARESWDEDHPIHEVIDADLAYEILDLLLCDPSAAKARLENELELEFQRQIERNKEDAAEAAYDRYLSSSFY